MSVSPQIQMDSPAASPSTPSDSDYHRLAEDLFDEFFKNKAFCPVCFARKRTYYPEFDVALANRLYRGPSNGKRGSNKLTFDSMGFKLNEDGSLQVNSATSDADPSTYQEVVPETMIDITDDRGRVIGQEFKPARSRTICQCGVIDYDFDEARSTGQLYDAIENIGEHVKEQYPEYWFNTDAAKAVIEKASSVPSLAGRDRDVLIGAMELGLKHGHEADDYDPEEVARRLKERDGDDEDEDT